MTPSQEFAQKRAEAEQLIREHAPARLQEQLISLLRPAIALTATRSDDAQIPLGASKFGGAPDVPLEFEWPMWNEKPLGFLAQINLEEVALFDVEGVLPKSGLLLFFLSLDEQNPVWGEPEQREGWRALFTGEPLHRVEPPTNSHWIVPLLTQQVVFDWGWSFSNNSFENVEWDEDEWSDFQWEILERPPHRMFGCAYAPQLSPLVVATNGFQGKSAEALYDEVSTTDWELLLQLDTGANEFFAGHDDLGWFYFLIRRNDLKNGDFSCVWFNEQCT